MDARPTPRKLPIFDGTNGRTVIGFATSVESATRAIKQLVTIPQGFELVVWQRAPHMQEILDLPAGYCYAISK